MVDPRKRQQHAVRKLNRSSMPRFKPFAKHHSKGGTRDGKLVHKYRLYQESVSSDRSQKGESSESSDNEGLRGDGDNKLERSSFFLFPETHRIPWIIVTVFTWSYGYIFRRLIISYLVRVGDLAMNAADQFGRPAYVESANYWYNQALMLTTPQSYTSLLPLLRLCGAQHRAFEMSLARDTSLDAVIRGLTSCISRMRELEKRWHSAWGRYWYLRYYHGLTIDLSDALLLYGDVLVTRYTIHRQNPDIERAISVYRELVSRFQEPSPYHLRQLGVALLLRYQYQCSPKDLEEAVMTLRTSYEHRGISWNKEIQGLEIARSYGDALCIYAECYGMEGLREDPIPIHMKALSNLSEDHDWLRPKFLSSLTRSLTIIGEMQDKPSLLAEAREHLEQLVKSHESKRDCSYQLALARFNLAAFLLNSCRRFVNIGDLDNAIQHLHLSHSDNDQNYHGLSCTILTNLGIAYRMRAVYSAHLSDMNAAVLYQQKAIQTAQIGNILDLTYKSNLVAALVTRYRFSNSPRDINDAAQAGYSALEGLDSLSKFYPVVASNLVSALSVLSQRAHDTSIIQAAISIGQTAMELHNAPGHKSHVIQSSNLAGAFMVDSQLNSSLESAQKARTILQALLPELPHDHQIYPIVCNILADTILQIGTLQPDLMDLDKVVTYRHEASVSTLYTGPEYLYYCNALANALVNRHRSLSRQGSDLASAVACYSEAIDYRYGPQAIRYICAISWANVCIEEGHPSASAALWFALQMFRRLAFLDTSLNNRMEQLAANDISIASLAARYAIETEDFEASVELLEYGRAVLWQEGLGPRAAVEQLRQSAPDLADRMVSVLRQLDASGNYSDSKYDDVIIQESHARSHAQLAEEWDDLLEEAWACLGSERYMRPKAYSELRFCARQWPVVIINTHKRGCDALILVDEERPVSHLALPAFTWELAQNIAQGLFDFVQDSSRQGRGEERHLRVKRHPQQSGQEKLLSTLRTLWFAVVDPVFKELDLQPVHMAERPQIYWVLTGPISQAPLHAAGPYPVDNPQAPIASSYAIFSYSPLLEPLLPVTSTELTSSSSLLAIAVPKTSYGGAAEITGTLDEMLAIQDSGVNNTITPVKFLAGTAATTKQVLDRIHESSILHFACHGVQALNPLESSLLLYDKPLGITSIINQAANNVKLVVLSACSTAQGDTALRDEVIHLAAAFLFTGIRSAIATLWSINDHDASVVFKTFYETLLDTSGGINPENSAYALHVAVEHLRESGVGPERWIPFIHMGR